MNVKKRAHGNAILFDSGNIHAPYMLVKELEVEFYFLQMRVGTKGSHRFVMPLFTYAYTEAVRSPLYLLPGSRALLKA